MGVYKKNNMINMKLIGDIYEGSLEFPKYNINIITITTNIHNKFSLATPDTKSIDLSITTKSKYHRHASLQLQRSQI